MGNTVNSEFGKVECAEVSKVGETGCAKAREFSKVERAEISKDFRELIKQHGMCSAILSLVESNSPKAPIRRSVLVHQCRKPSFRTEFSDSCKRLAGSYPSLACEILNLKDDVLKAK